MKMRKIRIGWVIIALASSPVGLVADDVSLEALQGREAELKAETARVREEDSRIREEAALMRETLRLRREGDYPLAAASAERWIAAMEQVHGRSSPKVAAALEMLGMMRRETDEIAASEAAFLRALTIRLAGEDGKALAICRRHLGDLYSDQGSFSKARDMLEAALEEMTAAVGAESSSTVSIANSLGLLLMKLGDYDAAERHLRAVFDASRKEGSDSATSTQNLAVLYSSMGSHARAVPFLEEAVRLLEKQKGASHPDALQAKTQLGRTLAQAGRHAEGVAILSMAIKELESRMPESGTLALALNNLAAAYAYGSTDDWEKAIPLLTRSLAIQVNLFGEKHPGTIATLDNLGYYKLRSGDVAAAQTILARAHSLAAEIYPSSHEQLANLREKRVWAEHALGHETEALKLCLEAREIREKNLAALLAFASERQRLDYYASGPNPFSHLATLGASEPLADTVVRLKGIVLDSILEDQRLTVLSTDPETAEVARALSQSRQGWIDAGDDAVARAQREREIEELETKRARGISTQGTPRRALKTTAKDVAAYLPANGALIEYIRYDHFLSNGDAESRYGAVVITRDHTPTWVPLADCQKVDPLIASYPNAVSGRTDDETLHALLRDLHDQLWSPVASALPVATRQVVISPDGWLNTLSFATFLDREDRFLCEGIELCYVSTGRDLLLPNAPLPAAPSLLALANPAFSERTSAPIVAGVSIERLSRLAGNLRLPPLPGTEEEVDLLADTAREAGVVDITVLKGAKATEETLRALASPPALLHLATHGFFTDQTTAERNPMYCSGLALAGATQTLAAWKEGRVPDSRSDGILTAAEFGALPLDGTWLLVLSACETGLGKTVAGEGILGLRRGIAQATRAHQLLTLWSIGDDSTPYLMNDFYRRILAGTHPGTALWQAQRQQLATARKQYGLLRAVRDAGPFVVAITGKQPST